MTENKDKHCDKEKDTKTADISVADKEHEKDKGEHDRVKLHFELVDMQSGDSSQLQEQEQLEDADNSEAAQPPNTPVLHTLEVPTPLDGAGFYRSACASGDLQRNEILLVDLDTGEVSDFGQRLNHKDKDEFGTQRVYKKTSPNCVLTLYLPTREITLAGNSPSVLRGIVYVDPKAIQGYRIYAQLTLTFRYGREDEEVMGLRFCNEAIMSLHQVWPRNEEPARESLSPLQEALMKRLGEGAHPFTLTLTPQAPPSVQLVPAKRYYGAPIGTSYDVRCFIADKTDEKFHRRASVKMGVRVIYRTDVFHANGPENFAALINSQTASPPMTAALTSPPAVAALQDTSAHTTAATTAAATPPTALSAASNESNTNSNAASGPEASSSGTHDVTGVTAHGCGASGGGGGVGSENRVVTVKPRKSERGESFPKLRLSPKSFRFSGRFGRSKSEIEKCPNDPFYNYSKSFQEYDSICGGGPQGAVDKPFLLQDGRVGLRASLDKAWYTHGEDVCVTVNVRNDSRKTVRKVRVCAIQHVDVCMFNNGKFKNVVADSDTNSPGDRVVPPGGTLNVVIVLKPQRGQTKNWIALEDTLQRSTEPEEITGAIAASAIRSPNFLLPAGHGGNPCASPAVGIPQPIHYHTSGASSVGSICGASGGGGGGVGDDRNVFAIYVSYYVKVKLTLSGMGGELSLKLPFVLVHVDESQRAAAAAALSEVKLEKLALHEVPANRKNGNKLKALAAQAAEAKEAVTQALDRIESADDELIVSMPLPSENCASAAASNSNGNGATKRRLIRSETLAKDLDEESEYQIHSVTESTEAQASIGAAATHNSSSSNPPKDMEKQREGRAQTLMSSSVEVEQVHVVQIHTQAHCRENTQIHDRKQPLPTEPQLAMEDSSIIVADVVTTSTSGDAHADNV